MKRVPLKHFDKEFWDNIYQNKIINLNKNFSGLDLLENTLYFIDIMIYLETRKKINDRNIHHPKSPSSSARVGG